MKILVINAGSSSLKYQLIDMTNESVMAKGLVERIGIAGSNLVHKYGVDCGSKKKYEQAIANHTEAMELVLKVLVDKEVGVIANVKEINAVGHRVLHGGMAFTKSCVIDEACKAAIRKCIPLGPLHNPANLMGIEACEKAMEGVPNVAVFDTAFHQTMPEKAYLYGVPLKYFREDEVRRYGFHGTSHRYIAGEVVKILGAEHSKVVICHLGNGSSLSAVVDGKCVDTSMGLTPLQGVLMGTRSGDVDPAVVEFIANKEGWNVTRTLNMLNKKSGLLGLSEVSSDMRDVLTYSRAAAGEEIEIGGNKVIAEQEKIDKCRTTVDCWQYSIKKYIGAYAAAMGGLDALVFTAGIGENNPVLRAMVCDGLEFLGVKLDAASNDEKKFGKEGEISAADSRVRVFVIPTNEELAIARDTLELTAGKK